MKAVYLILGIPTFIFIVLAFTLDVPSLLPLYAEYDLTPYLAARSLASDGDLAFTSVDSDRYFQEHLVRPSHFKVTMKKIVNSKGEFEQYPAFYDPELYVFFLIPFVGLLKFRGLFLFHALLIGLIYSLGFLYYKSKNEDTTLPALNSLIYFTLVPLPILFLLPSSYLFLFAAITASIFFALRERPILSALLLAIAASVSVWAVLFAALFIVRWQEKGEQKLTAVFLVTAAASLFFIWGMERLMYPSNAITEIRQVDHLPFDPIDQVWNSLPAVTTTFFSAPSLQKLSDFLFGRTAGFFVYGFAAGALLISCVWLWRDRLIRNAMIFFLFYLLVMAFSAPSSWRVLTLASDVWILLAALPFFLVPLMRPRNFFVVLATLCSVFVGPILVNPAGAFINRFYYLQSFPYSYMPAELSLLGRSGISASDEFQYDFPGGKMYLLNENFYPENGFFWVHGDSSLEFVLELTQKPDSLQMRIQNGSIDNVIQLQLGSKTQELRVLPSDVRLVDITPYFRDARTFENRYYLHGKIISENGYIPKLLSRENLDYRYLGCRVEFTK